MLLCGNLITTILIGFDKITHYLEFILVVGYFHLKFIVIITYIFNNDDSVEWPVARNIC